MKCLIGDALMDDVIPDRGCDESGNAKPGVSQ